MGEFKQGGIFNAAADFIVEWTRKSGFVRLLVTITLAAVLMTSILHIAHIYTWWGENPRKLLIVGLVDTLLISITALPLIILVIMRLRSAEAENAAKSAYLDSILRTSTDMAIAATDMNFNVTLFNPAAEEMFGYMADDVLGKDIRELHQGDGIETERFLAALDTFRREGEVSFSLAVPHRDGFRYLDARVAGIMDAEGRQIGYALMARDITRRREDERALSESEEKFRILVEYSLVGVYIIQDERFVYVNPRFAEIVGYERDEITGGMKLEDIVTADTIGLSRENISRRLSGEIESAHYQLKGKRKDGTVIDAEVLGTVTTYNGMPAIIGTLIDITEQIKSANALRESEERYRSLVEQAADALIVHDMEGSIREVNSQACLMFGYSRDEMLARSIFDLDNIIQPEKLLSMWQSMEPGEPVTLESQAIRRDGDVIAVEIRLSRIESAGERLVQALVRDITERKKVEDRIRGLNEELERRVSERTAELEDSERRYRMLMEDASDGIGIMAPDGRISAVNRRLCELLGYTEEEVKALDVEDIFTPDEMPLVAADIRLILAGETVVRDRTVRRKDGTTLQVELSAKMLEDGSVQAIGRDITARKEAERALRKSEERLRHVVEHMPVMMCAFGEDGSIIVWNRECENVTGYTAEEIVGRPDALRVLYPDDDYREAMLAEWKRRGNNFRDWEWEVTCKDGSVKTVAWSNRSDVISIPGWANWGIGIDVTEHNKSRDELKRSEGSYRTMAKNLPGIVYRVYVREGGKMQFFNDMLEPLTGYAAEELCPGQCCSIDTLIVPEDRDGVVEQIKRAATEERPFLVEYRIKHKSGDTRYLQERGRPVRGRNGLPQFIDGVIIDITELKKAQGEREAMQARLNESQKMEAIGNLAGGIAHDFNNLLTVIQGDNMLVKSEVGEGHPASEHIEHIDAAAARASELIKKLMLFSRRERMARAPMDLNTTVDDILAMVMRLIGKHIAVNAALGRDIWSVNADVSGIEQVIMNLVLNARDAMPEGGTLSISTENVEFDEAACRDREPAMPGKYVRLSVTDTGSGMEDETRKRIFEPFFTTKGRGRGTGLGLSVVYGIVREHGGWIDVTSSPGAGSRFDVYIAAA